MRRFHFVLIAIICGTAAAGAFGQEPAGSRAAVQAPRGRMHFVGAPDANSVVSGELVLRVSEDRMMRPDWIKPVLRIPGEGDLACGALPWDYHWDTRRSSNGEKLVQILLIDTRSGSVTVLDTLDVWVKNRRSHIQPSRPMEQGPQLPPSQVDPEPAPPSIGERIVITIKGPAHAITAQPGSGLAPTGKPRLPGLANLGPAVQTQMPADSRGDESRDSIAQASPDDTLTASPDEIRTSYGLHQWYLRGGILFHEDKLAQTTDAFMPWNESGLSPISVTANAEGAKVETNKGSRTISLTKPASSDRGYDGFIRLRLGRASDRGTGHTALKLAAEIDSWQGVPYLWGGASRSGTDCSGFVMAMYHALGISLPHGSMYLRTHRSSATTVVHDELRYGDILVYPGHCAIYTGEGTTAETVGGHVGHRTIWIRSSVVVRRFLEQESDRPWEHSVFASRGGRRKGAHH